MLELKIDPEFRGLIPPLSDDEYKQLEENIVEAGEVYDPIITWEGAIVDGHNRWNIIRAHPEVSYKTYEVVFLNRNEAILWIINNQLGRRNLNKADAILLAQKRGEVIAEEAKAKQAEAGKKNMEAYNSGASSIKNDKTSEPPVNTQKEVAKLAGVSSGTVAQFEQVQKKKPELIDSIRKGEMTIGGAYRAIKEEEKAAEMPKPIEPPRYTIDDLLKEIESSGENYLKFLRGTLAMRNSVYEEADSKAKVRDEIIKIKGRIEAIEELLK